MMTLEHKSWAIHCCQKDFVQCTQIPRAEENTLALSGLEDYWLGSSCP